MKLEVVKNAVTSKVARQLLLGKKHSPTLMFAGGVVGMAGTVVLACRATLKLEEVLDGAEHSHELARNLDHPKYSEGDRKRDHILITVRTGTAVAKLYAPSVALGVVSVAALTGSHVVLTRRNVALTAAYKTIEEAFGRYRQRVIDDVGEAKDLEYRRGVKEVEIHDTEKGKVRKGRVQVDGISQYGKFFDEMNKHWSPEPSYNFVFLKGMQEYANQRLNAKGHLFLNEIYDDLGFDRTPGGAVVGWVKGNGDDYIDFGIFTGKDISRFHDFITGEEGLWLDFNVDGIIYDKI